MHEKLQRAGISRLSGPRDAGVVELPRRPLRAQALGAPKAQMLAAQQLERGRVSGLKSPRGEPDEVREQQRERLVAAAAPRRLRHRLPELKSGEAEFLEHALALAPESRDAPGDDLNGTNSGRRQRV